MFFYVPSHIIHFDYYYFLPGPHSLSLSAYVYKYPIPSLPSDEKKKKHSTRAFMKLVALLAWSQSHREADQRDHLEIAIKC